MASEWQNIAALLELPSDRIKCIRQENCMVVNDCLRAMVTEWLQQTGANPSWNALAEAVESLGNQAIAEEIRDNHVSDH